MGSAWISGEDTLGMAPVDDIGYPLRGRVSLPRMITAQFDQINSLIMIDLQRSIVDYIQRLVRSTETQDWQVFFVTAAVLCDLVSRMRTDRARHAKDNAAEV